MVLWGPHKMSNLAVIEGTVTEIDDVLYTFLVELQTGFLKKTTVRVFVALLFADNPLQKMPQIGTQIKLKSPLFNQFGSFITSVVLTTDCFVDGVFTVDVSQNSFLSIVKSLRFKPTDLLHYSHNYMKLEKYLKIEDVKFVDVLYQVFCCLGRMEFEIEFLKNFQYLDRNEANYKEFSYFTFGIHRNWRQKYIIGYLFFKNNGALYFSDNTREIPCILLKRDVKIDLIKYFNCIILTRQYIIATEIYNGKTFCTTEYLLINLETTASTPIKYKFDQILQNEDSIDLKKITKVSCTIISKSQIIAISSDDVIFWLEIRIDKIPTPIFLRLHKPYVNFYYFLVINYNYNIFQTTKPTHIWDQEIERFARRKYRDKKILIYEFPSNNHFVPLNTTNPPEVLSSSEAADKLSTDSKPLNFEGIISLKLFTNPLSSRAVTNWQKKDYGTAGYKTHKLVFKIDIYQTLELYLNNWENLATPLGLIPNMKVIFYNVIPQSKKYLKSTILTSFQIIDYKPTVEFETTNLLNQNLSETFYLGAGYCIPTSTIIWGQVTAYTIESLNFAIIKEHLQGQIKLFAEDVMGKCKIIAKHETAVKLIKVMLGLQEKSFEIWLQGFKELQPLSYVKNQIVEETEQNQHLMLLYNYFATLNQPFYAKCRKMDNNEDDKIGIYFLLDTKKNY